MKTKEIIKKLQGCKTGEQFNALLKEFDGQDIGGRLAFNFKTKTAYIAADDSMSRKIYKTRLAIGLRLKSEREKAGISKYSITAETNVSQNILNSIEAGTAAYTIDSLIKYISVVGISRELLEDIANDLEFLNPKPIKSVMDCDIEDLFNNNFGLFITP